LIKNAINNNLDSIKESIGIDLYQDITIIIEKEIVILKINMGTEIIVEIDIQDLEHQNVMVM
jgi:hypothetical protein